MAKTFEEKTRKGSRDELASDPREERGAVVLGGHRQEALAKQEDRIARRVDRAVAGQQQLDPGVDQEGAEDEDHPGELGEQRRAGDDEDAAQDDRPEDAPEEHPVLMLGGHREVGEDDQEHEQVVDREGVLDDVPGDELERRSAAEMPGEVGREEAAHGDEEEGVAQRRLRRDHLGAAVEHREVEDEEGTAEDEEGRPEERGGD
jgi:hypothetical protein